MKTSTKIGLWLAGAVPFIFLIGSVGAWLTTNGEPSSHPGAMIGGYVIGGLAYVGVTLMWKYMPEDKPASPTPQSIPQREQSGMTWEAVARQNVVGTLGYNYLANPPSYAPPPPPPPMC